MDRKERIRQCFQRGERLVTSAPLYRDALDGLFRWLITTDGVADDQTTRVLNLHMPLPAVVISKQAGIIAGVEEARFLLESYTHDATRLIETHVQDGDSVGPDTPILSMALDAGAFLPLERTILNLIGRMSGIATQTHRLIELAQQGSALVAGTRKTPWMLVDKKAIFDGGGLTHRLSLADGILIKDNHLKALRQQLRQPSLAESILEAVKRTVASLNPFFEIEVEGAEHGRAALSAYEGAIKDNPDDVTMVLMLDNFDVPGAAAFIEEVRTHPVYDQVLFEASGDIIEQSAGDWSRTGVDVISLGALTHSVTNFNVSMALE